MTTVRPKYNRSPQAEPELRSPGLNSSRLAAPAARPLLLVTRSEEPTASPEAPPPLYPDKRGEFSWKA